eukprot:Rmarinus@m.15392
MRLFRLISSEFRRNVRLSRLSLWQPVRSTWSHRCEKRRSLCDSNAQQPRTRAPQLRRVHGQTSIGYGPRTMTFSPACSLPKHSSKNLASHPWPVPKKSKPAARPGGVYVPRSRRSESHAASSTLRPAEETSTASEKTPTESSFADPDVTPAEDDEARGGQQKKSSFLSTTIDSGVNWCDLDDDDDDSFFDSTSPKSASNSAAPAATSPRSSHVRKGRGFQEQPHERRYGGESFEGRDHEWHPSERVRRGGPGERGARGSSRATRGGKPATQWGSSRDADDNWSGGGGRNGRDHGSGWGVPSGPSGGRGGRGGRRGGQPRQGPGRDDGWGGGGRDDGGAGWPGSGSGDRRGSKGDSAGWEDRSGNKSMSNWEGG